MWRMPDHWHAQMSIDGAHAGKDVYVEKPMAHTPDEKYWIIDAVGTTKRVVEEGPQRRSFPHFCEAKEPLADGGGGDARLVKARSTGKRGGARSPNGTPVRRGFSIGITTGITWAG